MKTIIFILLSLSLGSFVTADQSSEGANLSADRLVPADQSAEVQCNIENYQDFIKKHGLHNCNLREADLTGADLREANLIGANLILAV